MTLKQDAMQIALFAIEKTMPGAAVEKALENISFTKKGKIILISVGKAAWSMAKAAYDKLGDIFYSGVVITKYGHSCGKVGNFQIFEAGHPVPDENGFLATEEALKAVSGLNKEDTVLFLLSGGGSALFEKPLVDGQEIKSITNQLLASGADIVEMNTIRKRLSAVKGGKFAQSCYPATVQSVVLSDIVGDPLDMIASGPAYPDSSTNAQALSIVEKYKIKLSETAKKLLEQETPKALDNVKTQVTGSVKQLCKAAMEKAEILGYESHLLTEELTCEAQDAGKYLSKIAMENYNKGKSLAFVAGGETVVHLKGKGKGGRNQELALSSAIGISGLNNVCIFSLGSDGTDGPTDAAGGIVDGNTEQLLLEKGIRIPEILNENDSYTALNAINALLMTGPTGTNVNDVAVVLIGK